MIAKRVDDNQGEIVESLRKIGAEVTHIHEIGKGVPDLLVSYMGLWIVFEVKSDRQPKSKRKLTKDEEKYISRQKAPVFIIKNTFEAIKILHDVVFGKQETKNEKK